MRRSHFLEVKLFESIINFLQAVLNLETSVQFTYQEFVIHTLQLYQAV